MIIKNNNYVVSKLNIVIEQAIWINTAVSFVQNFNIDVSETITFGLIY